MSDIDSDRSLVEVRANLDLPGETGRQAKIFGAWLACLFAAIVLSSVASSRVGESGDVMFRTEEELTEKRAARVRVGFPVGILLPAFMTWIIHLRHRRGGGHARGIFVDVTEGRELRIWGRGYGTRVSLEDAEVTERLVDVYAGRLGAWRQRRLKVHARSLARGGAGEIEIATRAIPDDATLGLKHEGGEGDCVELDREDFLRIREAVLAGSQPASA